MGEGRCCLEVGGDTVKLSLRKSITIVLLILLIALTGIFGISDAIALRFVQNRIYQNTEDTVTLYQQQMDDDLHRIDSYLYTIMTQNSSFIRLSYMKGTEKNWYSPVSILGRELNNSIYNYKAEAFYDYLPEADTLILGTNSNTPFAEVKAVVRDTIRSQNGTSKETKWRLVELNDAWYLMRILQSDRQYLGALVRISDLIEGNQDIAAESHYYCLVDSSRRMLSEVQPDTILDEKQFDEPYSIENVNGVRCLVVHKKLEEGNFYLTSVTAWSAIGQVTMTLKAALAVSASLIVLIWIILYFAVQRSILKPVTTITDALSKVASGNLEQRIPVHNQSLEFQSMAKTYNIMVSEIKDLKINVYEQQIAHEKLESQYLKQQITPHFMINCLNTACQLTECGELELARKLLRELSVHLRYILSSGKTVRLAEELDLVQNYIELSGIRYPDSLHARIECPDELKNCMVVPLMLLNFVENTIKHEVVMGETLEIHIQITEKDREGQEGICSVLWDNGNGFEEDVLEEIRKLSAVSVGETSTTHIGITNVIQRTKKEFPGAEFEFSNHECGGARIEIWIPKREMSGNGKDRGAE